MTRLLIVDDETSYCRQLEIAMTADGWEVATASSGRDAIDVGARFRPDVAITDWMLCDDIHGLHVSQVLRAVVPDCRTVLITGFPSDDLRAEAKKLGISEFVEKPFTLDRIRTAARSAENAPLQCAVLPPLALLEVSPTGEILLANPRAVEMLAEASCNVEPTNIAELLPGDSDLRLDDAVERWLAVSPHCTKPTLWHVRIQPACGDRTRFVVLREQSDPQHMTSSLIDMLFGLKDTAYGRWSLEHRVLVVSQSALSRRLIVPMLESAGAGCYGAANESESLRLLHNDAGIRCIVLDSDDPGEPEARLIERMKEVRDDLVFVGSSAGDRRPAFEQLGVDHFLLKPWRTVALVNLLTGRIGNCHSCGAPLPIRRAHRDDTWQSWVCVGCGTQYEGQFDESFPEEFARNAARID